MLLLRGVRPLGGAAADILISGEDVRVIEPGEQPPGARIVAGDGLIGLPGLVDLHTHLREPGGEDAETIRTGTEAAARGGFTAVFAMPNTHPVADSPEAVERVVAAATESDRCDVYPVGAITVGLAGKQLANISGMAHSQARVHVFSDDGHCVCDPYLMRDALRAVQRVGGVLAQHAEEPALTAGAQANDGKIAQEMGLIGWPAAAEEVIIARDCVLAGHERARLHVCHVSTAGGVELVRWAKRRGFPVSAEATPHHLLLTEDLVRTGDAVYKVNPPLRTSADVEALRAGLADGTIDAVATDHAPHSALAKSRGWDEAPMGMLGLETALAVVADTMVRSGRMSWSELADRMATRPATIGGVRKTQGESLGSGRASTLCLVDPEANWVVEGRQLASIGDNTPFEGTRFHSRVVATLRRGSVTYDAAGLFSG